MLLISTMEMSVAILNDRTETDTDAVSFLFDRLGPVVQSIVSLTNSLRGQLIKCFTTL